MLKQRLREIVIVPLCVAAQGHIATVQNKNYVVGQDVGWNVSNVSSTASAGRRIERKGILVQPESLSRRATGQAA